MLENCGSIGILAWSRPSDRPQSTFLAHSEQPTMKILSTNGTISPKHKKNIGLKSWWQYLFKRSCATLWLKMKPRQKRMICYLVKILREETNMDLDEWYWSESECISTTLMACFVIQQIDLNVFFNISFLHFEIFMQFYIHIFVFKFLCNFDFSISYLIQWWSLVWLNSWYIISSLYLIKSNRNCTERPGLLIYKEEIPPGSTRSNYGTVLI